MKNIILLLLLCPFVFSIAVVDLSNATGANSTSLWIEDGSNIYYDLGRIMVGKSIALSPTFPYQFNSFAHGSGSGYLYSRYDATADPVSTGEIYRKGNYFEFINQYGRINNLIMHTQGNTYETRHEVSGVGAMPTHRQTVIGAVYDTQATGNSIAGNAVVTGAVFNTTATLLSPDVKVIGAYFYADGGTGSPPQDYAIYSAGNSILGNNGRTNQIPQSPHDCTMYGSAFGNVYSTSTSSLGEAGSTYAPYDIMCMMYIPYGYEITGVTVFGTPSKTVELRESTIQSATSTLHDTCTTGTLCTPTTPIAETGSNYVFVFIDFTTGTDRLQGLRWEMQRQFDYTPEYEVTP